MTILQALSIAFSFTGQTVPDVALAEMASELSLYPEVEVLSALKRCRSELKFIKYSDILDRMPNQHPGVEAAWAIIAPKVASDVPTVFVTDEMREAFGAALALEDDMVAARMAFKEVYEQAVRQSRSSGRHLAWSPIFGTDRNSKEAAILEAVKRGHITADWAKRNLPVEAHESLLTFATSQEIARR